MPFPFGLCDFQEEITVKVLYVSCCFPKFFSVISSLEFDCFVSSHRLAFCRFHWVVGWIRPRGHSLPAPAYMISIDDAT